jgi:hypothetical protein
MWQPCSFSSWRFRILFAAGPISQLVYQLFDLTTDEIALIESSLQS